MTKEELLEVADEAILSWENKLSQARKGLEIDLSPRTCSYCKLFFDNDCVGCPIYILTDEIECRETPFKAILDYEREDLDDYLHLIALEISFLKKIKTEISNGLCDDLLD